MVTEGRLVLEFTFDDLMRIRSWHFATRQHRELIPRSVIAMQQDPAMVEQLSKNITRQGLTNHTLNFLRVRKTPFSADRHACIALETESLEVASCSHWGPGVSVRVQVRWDHCGSSWCLAELYINQWMERITNLLRCGPELFSANVHFSYQLFQSMH